MNIFHKAALQSMRRSRTRTIVTVIGVVLSAAMITAVAAFGTSLLHFLLNGSIAKYGNWHVAFCNAPASFAQARAHDEGVTGTAALANIGYAALPGAKSPEKPYLFIAGFSEQAFDTLPVRLVSGRLPENSGEVVVPSHVALKGGVRFRVGDTLALAVGSRMDGSRILDQHDPFQTGEGAAGGKETLVPKAEKTYTVVGICERPGFEEHEAPGYTLITKAEQADSYSVFVTLANPRGVKAYASGTAGAGAYIFNDDVLRFMGVSENRLFNALVLTVGGVLIAIVMLGSIFLIYNSFHISMNERTQQFGILLSVGATAKQLRNSVLFEGLCIGAVGIPIGVAAGIGSVGLLIPVVAKNFVAILPAGVPLTLSVSAPAVLAAAAVSLVTILISAYIPARKAANTPVMDCIRQTGEIKTEAKSVKTSGLAQRMFGLEGTLALKNFKRNKKRYRSIVLSLVLSIVLFVSGSTFGTTLKRLSKEVVVDIDYDILLTTEGIDDSGRAALYDKLKSADGVYESLTQTVYEYVCETETGGLSDRYREYAGYAADETVHIPMYLQFVEDGVYQSMLETLGLDPAEYTGQDAKRIAFARQRVGGADGAASEVFDVFAGRDAAVQTMRRAGEQGRAFAVTIVDTYLVDPPPMPHDKGDTLVFMMTAPYSLQASFDTRDCTPHTAFGFYTKDPLRTAGEMETMIQEEGLTAPYSLYNVADVLEQFRSITFVINVFTYIFVIMISLIAAANVFNTISTNMKLRRRELAMLRSVGMGERDFNKMMCFECFFYGARTLLFGIPIAGGASFLIHKWLASQEKLDHFAFAFPWGSMAVSVLGVFLIVFITMLYAVRGIKKENIIDALRDDMT